MRNISTRYDNIARLFLTSRGVISCGDCSSRVQGYILFINYGYNELWILIMRITNALHVSATDIEAREISINPG